MVKAKSRLVARGVKPREEVDFGETCAPTVSSSCVRLQSAIACECELDLCHFDVDQAFVQSDLEEDVFLRLPKRCCDISGNVVGLNKRLYGLKQASRAWHAHLTTCLKRLGFGQCMADVCVFRLIENGRVTITAVVHVDDMTKGKVRQDMRWLEPNHSCQEPRWFEVVWRMPILERSQKGYSNDIPT